MGLSKKEEYILNNFDLNENNILSIRKISQNLGTKKYSVWIARESSKNKDILSDHQSISNIIDWVMNDKVDLLKYDFKEANKKQLEWHSSLIDSSPISEKIKSKEVDEDRIIFRCSDNRFFFYLLNEKDLKEEGDFMMHCVGGGQYKQKIRKAAEGKNGSFIISLRDEKNMPHATIEINSITGDEIQISGKGNHNLPSRLKKKIVEFALYSSGYENVKDKDVLDILNFKVSDF